LCKASGEAFPFSIFRKEQEKALGIKFIEKTNFFNLKAYFRENDFNSILVYYADEMALNKGLVLMK